MLNGLFLKNKISRQIKQNGSHYIFKKYSLDEFNQKSDEPEYEIEIDGLYHEVIANVKGLSDNESARVVSVPKSYIMCLLEDAGDVSLDDEVIINGYIYKVIKKNNISNLNVVYDIELEMIKDESNT